MRTHISHLVSQLFIRHCEKPEVYAWCTAFVHNNVGVTCSNRATLNTVNKHELGVCLFKDDLNDMLLPRHSSSSLAACAPAVLKKNKNKRNRRLVLRTASVELLGVQMRWFGFGFNAFGQICVQEKSGRGESSSAPHQVKISHPAELSSHVDRSRCCLKTSQIRVSWSRRASLHLEGECIKDIA